MTSGVFGLAALLALGCVVVARLLRAPRDEAWLVGSVAALGALAMFEPFNLTVTPLLFLLAGIGGWAATLRRTATSENTMGVAGAGRLIVGAGLLIGVGIAALSLVAATYQADGERYESEASLRTSLALAPGGRAPSPSSPRIWRWTRDRAMLKRLQNPSR